MAIITDQYEPSTVEPKWQAYWEQHRTFSVPNPGEPGFDASKPKYYVLDMFPYPSGAGLHVGHPEGYTATDILARYHRHRGYNVLHPIGYDAFGLPAEQYAVEHGVHPAETTKRNIDNIRRQIKMLGFSYDWNRELSTTDESYYRWTQWIFRQLFESWYDRECEWTGPDGVKRTGRARPISELVVPGDVQSQGQGAINEYVDSRRLAYIDEVPVNWCPALGTVLANEEVTNEGRSDRGNHPVFRRPLRQWMLRITEYADRLERDLDVVDWPESIKIMQRNWIGRSEGAEIEFPIAGRDESLRVFTTRPDTVFGATYMVVAPEHRLVDALTTDAQRDAVRAYRDAAARKSDLERTELQKEKSGVFTGAYAINPLNDQKIPIWIADYVLATYGTGAIMAVPGQDERDWEFAEKFDLPIIRTVQPPSDFDGKAYLGEGPAINSGFLDGLNIADAKAKIIDWLETNRRGRRRVNYKLRDWLFSRQRYWGEPFPILHGEDGRIVSVAEDELPVRLPEMRDFSPRASDDPNAPPEPPLSRAPDAWLRVHRDENGATSVYTREVNTMPQWAGSCWYYLRYLDAKNDECFVSKEAEHYWMPIDLYVGGAEHAVLHLLYARFWHKVLFDLGYVSTVEPFGRLFNQGMIRSFAYRDARGVPIGYDDIDFREDGPHHRQSGAKLTESVEKMAKSLKNVVNPETVVHEYGADTLRLYEMYMGPLEASKPWNPRDVPGVYRFLQRAWRLIIDDRTGRLAAAVTDEKPDEATERLMHRTIKEVEEDIVAMKFNTAIAELIKFVNEMTPRDRRPRSVLERFVLLLSPFAPHLAEELWQRLRGDAWTQTLAYEAWPAVDPALAKHDEVEIAVQINGKVKAKLTMDADATEEQMRETTLADERVAAQIAGKTIKLVKCVPGRLVNIVVV